MTEQTIRDAAEKRAAEQQRTAPPVQTKDAAAGGIVTREGAPRG